MLLVFFYLKTPLVMKALLNLLKLTLFVIFFSNLNTGYSQTIITSSKFTAYNVTPSDMVQIMVVNNGNEITMYLEAQITNSANEKILMVTTTPFLLKKGVTNIQSNQFSLSSVNYSSSEQGSFLKINKRLPAGNFNYCVRILPTTSNEDGDEYCQDFDSNDNGILLLVFPPDGEEIETKTPQLMWMHNEPFNLLATGEYFRLVLVQLDEGQTAESGIQIKPPFYIKNNVNQHQVQYPFDAKKLEEGSRYGWKIQKMANGAVVNQTEAWEFKIHKEDVSKDMMFVALKRELDGSYYNVKNERIFFKFDEKYNQKNIACVIMNNKNEEIKPDLGKVNHADEEVDIESMSNEIIKNTGYNQFELDLMPYRLKKGFYFLKVVNNKNEDYKLKFYVE